MYKRNRKPIEEYTCKPMIFLCATSGMHHEDTREKEIQLVIKRYVCVPACAYVHAHTHRSKGDTSISRQRF